MNHLFQFDFRKVFTMIISCSRRTDIPTFYSEWFMNRIKEGFLYVRNPMNAHQVSEISLERSVVDCIVFWTKNPIPLLSRLDELEDYMYYFQFTLTGYGHDIEASLPRKKEILIPAFIELSEKIGPERVIWRYDPIFFNKKYTPEYHLRAFNKIADALAGYTHKCVISFLDLYWKNRKNMKEIHIQEKDNQWLLSFAGKLQDIAEKHAMVIESCAEPIDLSAVGIEHNACIDKSLIEKLIGGSLKVKKDPSQRKECLCASSIDIGAYNTCKNGCRYCYANFSPKVVLTNSNRYDPASPFLCDSLRDGDKVMKRPMRSLINQQMTFENMDLKWKDI